MYFIFKMEELIEHSSKYKLPDTTFIACANAILEYGCGYQQIIMQEINLRCLECPNNPISQQLLQQIQKPQKESQQLKNRNQQRSQRRSGRRQHPYRNQRRPDQRRPRRPDQRRPWRPDQRRPRRPDQRRPRRPDQRRPDRNQDVPNWSKNVCDTQPYSPFRLQRK